MQCFFGRGRKLLTSKKKKKMKKSIFLNNFLLTSPSLLQLWPSEKRGRKEERNNVITIGSQSYSVFQGFSKAKSANGGLILSSSQFLILHQLPQKIKLDSTVVKVDSKIIISLPKIQIPETHCTKLFPS
jgi:hypothetical protein